MLLRKLALLCLGAFLAASLACCGPKSAAPPEGSLPEEDFSAASGQGEGSYSLPHADSPTRSESEALWESSSPPRRSAPEEESADEASPQAAALPQPPPEESDAPSEEEEESPADSGTLFRPESEAAPAPGPGGAFYSSTEAWEDFEITSADFEEELLRLINEERAAGGVDPLVLEETLRWAARIRAPEVMLSLTHTRPDGASYYTAFDEAGFVYAGKWHGENVGSMYFTQGDYDAKSAAAFLFAELKSSSGHYSNMLSEHFTQIGIGAFVQREGSNIKIASAQMFASG